MAIRIPGLFDEIKPEALQGITGVLQNFKNPNWQQQQALREQMLRNPELAQKLIDMGPEAVERTYGRGTGGIAKGQVSNEKKMNDITGAKIQELLSRPDSDPDKQDFINRRVGIDPLTRKGKEQGIVINDQAIAGNQNKLNDEAEVTRLRMLANAERMRYKGDIRATYQNGNAEVKAAIFRVPELKDEYEKAVQTKAEEARLALSKSVYNLDVRRENRIDNEHSLKFKLEQAEQNRSIIDAGELTELGMATSGQAIHNLRKTPGLQQTLEKLTVAPKGQEAEWQAAQNLKILKEERAKKTKFTEAKTKAVAVSSFRNQIREDMNVLLAARKEGNQNPPSKEAIEAALSSINYLAQANPEAFPDGVPPNYTFDPDTKATGKEFGVVGLKADVVKIEAPTQQPAKKVSKAWLDADRATQQGWLNAMQPAQRQQTEAVLRAQGALK